MKNMDVLMLKNTRTILELCGRKLIVDFDKYHKEINSVPVTDTSDGITVNEDNFPDRILTVEVDLRDGKSKIIKE